jgi:hypothetical protein
MPRRRKTALQKTLTRALTATPSEVALFVPDGIDAALAEAMLAGVSGWADLAQILSLDESEVRARLTNPVRCAWISHQLTRAIEQRLGLVDAAVYAAALATGDPSRARFLAEKYQKIRPAVQQHLHAHLDVSQLTVEQLKTFIAERTAKFRDVPTEKMDE